MNERAPSDNKLLPIINNLLTMSGPLRPVFGTPIDAVGQLAKRAEATASLAAIVQRGLPGPVAAHVISAALRGGDLVVIVDSAAWATRVRYAGPTLKAHLAAAGQAVAGKVKVKVRGREKSGAG